LPVICKNYVWNDGVVPVQSAKWRIKDHATSKSVHTDLTGTSDFSNFVKPRLAIGPKGNHHPEAPELPQYPGAIGRVLWENASPDVNVGGYRMIGASYNAATSLPVLFGVPRNATPFAKSIMIPANQTVTVDLTVDAAADLGITFMAPAKISATLIDASGNEAAKNEAGSAESRAWFRSLYVDNEIVAGTWKLVLQNTAENELEAVVTMWTGATR
jgi:hypothetical protein